MPRKGRTDFLCLDCKVDTSRASEYYMLVDSTWYLVHTSERGMLCIGCVEDRLGRQLVRSDFNDSYLNWGQFPKSHRLANRMGLV
jgi:hypothetical protein